MQAADAPRRRADLRLSLQAESGRTYLLIQDPATGRFFRVREVEGFLLQQLDGATSLAEAHTAVLREFPGARLSVNAVVVFAERLESLGLLAGGPVTRIRVWDVGRRLTLRLPLFDTRPLFTRLLPVVRWLYRPGPLLACALLVLLATYEWLGSWDQWLYHARPHASGSQLAIYYLGFTLLSLFHEFGHGVTCRYFGAEARDVGVMLIYGIPAFYCNVSGAYTLPSRRQRVLVGLAGLGWQFVTGAAAFLMWRAIEPTTLTGRVLHAMVGFCGLTALINLIPFLRLDGYYILTDLLNLPNLRRRSFAYLGARARQLLFGGPLPSVGETPRERRIFFWFGLGSLVYSAAILVAMGGLLGRWLTAHLGGWGAVLWLLLFGSLLWPSLRRGWAAIRARLPSGRRFTMKPRLRLYLYLAALMGVMTYLFTGTWELTVACPTVLEATRRVAVRPRTAGVLADLRFREGDHVPRHAVLGSLDTFELNKQRQQIEAQLQAARIEGEIVARSVPVVAAEQEREVLEAAQEVRDAEEKLADREDLYPARRAEAERRVQEARAALDATERVAERLRADERVVAAGQLTPRMQAIQDRLGKVRVDAEFARKEINRVEYLVSEGAVEQRRLDAARAALDALRQEEEALRSELRAEQKQLEEQREDAEAEARRRRAAYEATLEAQRTVESETRPEKIERARREVQSREQSRRAATLLRGAADVKRIEGRVKAMDARRAAAELARLNEKIRQARIYAPATGILSTPRVEERIGRRYQEGEAICWLDLVDRLAARLMVDEKEIGAVQTGQRVRLRIGAYSERWYEGIVEAVAPRAEPYQGRQAYEVRVSLSNPTGDLRPGLTGFAKISCGERPLRDVLFRRLSRWFRTEVWSWF
ncbi:MAG: HlyD family efflux transporter periplasmic adaptor subunit [Armatimonadetes bacterium]|nr:HlyD family efflux transporter periplasmic adaptor subunit [Armatimonadota bacterium]